MERIKKNSLHNEDIEQPLKKKSIVIQPSFIRSILIFLLIVLTRDSVIKIKCELLSSASNTKVYKEIKYAGLCESNGKIEEERNGQSRDTRRCEG